MAAGSYWLIRSSAALHRRAVPGSIKWLVMLTAARCTHRCDLGGTTGPILPSGWLRQGLDQRIAFSEPGPVDPEEMGWEVGMWEHLLFSSNPRSEKVKNWNMTREKIYLQSFKGSKAYNYAALTRGCWALQSYSVCASLTVYLVGAPSGGRNWNSGQQFTTEIRTPRPNKLSLTL